MGLPVHTIGSQIRRFTMSPLCHASLALPARDADAGRDAHAQHDQRCHGLAAGEPVVRAVTDLVIDHQEQQRRHVAAKPDGPAQLGR